MTERSEWIAEDPVVLDENDQPIGTWWCNSHQRVATHVSPDGKRHCAPRLGGIMIPCFVEVVPALIEKG